MTEGKKTDSGFWRAVLRRRRVILALAAALVALSAFGFAHTRVQSDISSYLPEDCTSHRAITFLTDTFAIQGDATVCVAGDLTEYARVEALAESLSALADVQSVTWLGSYSALFKRPEGGAALALEPVNALIPAENVAALTRDAFFTFEGKPYYALTLSLAVSNSGSAATPVLNAVQALLDEYGGDTALGGNAASSKQMLESALGGLPKFLALAVAVIFVILLFTSRSAMSAVIFLVTIGLSIVYNMGSNVLMKSVSSITFSVAAILQLALSMDYAVFLTHAYERETEAYGYRPNADQALDAMIRAIRRTRGVILASALTTIAGFCALFAMRFSLGMDLGFCLAKGVLLSFLTVMFVQPCLMLTFRRACEKTEHRALTLSFGALERLPAKLRRLSIFLVAALLIPSLILSNSISFYYLSPSVDDGATGAKKAMQGLGSQMVYVSKVASDAQQLALVGDMRAMDGVASVTGFYALLDTLTRGVTVPITDAAGATLAEARITARDALRMLENGTLTDETLDSVTQALTDAAFKMLPARQEDAAAAREAELGRSMTVLERLALNAQVGLSLKAELEETAWAQAGRYADALSGASGGADAIRARFLREAGGETWTFYLVRLDGAAESVETTRVASRLGQLVARYDAWDADTEAPAPEAADAAEAPKDGGLTGALASLVGARDADSDAYMAVGNSQVVLDLQRATRYDFLIVAVVSALMILVILMATFRRVGLPVLLVLLIELAIQLNLCVPVLLSQSINFMSYIIISAIQMGATIDYAILLTQKYLSLPAGGGRAGVAARESAHPVIVSMTILLCACLSVYVLAADGIVKEITLMIGRGSLISAAVVLLILPAILSIGDRKKRG